MASNKPVNLAFKAFDPEGGVSDMYPILFMHGITSSKRHWEDIPQAVADATKRKAFALDTRNHGDSEWTDEFDYDCMVNDLLHFMDSMKMKRAILVGHSMGGIVGIKAALRKPERVEKLVVEDMYVRTVPREERSPILACIRLAKAALQEVPDGADEGTAKKFIVDFILRNLSAELRPMVTKEEYSNLPLKRTENGRYSFEFNADAVENILVSEKSENKGVYPGPASFMYGGLSPFHVGEEEEHIKKFFPSSEFVEFPNATHKVHSDSPKEFTEALIKFILKE